MYLKLLNKSHFMKNYENSVLDWLLQWKSFFSVYNSIATSEKAIGNTENPVIFFHHWPTVVVQRERTSNINRCRECEAEKRRLMLVSYSLYPSSRKFPFPSLLWWSLFLSNSDCGSRPQDLLFQKGSASLARIQQGWLFLRSEFLVPSLSSNVGMKWSFAAMNTRSAVILGIPRSSEHLFVDISSSLSRIWTTFLNFSG